MGKVLDISIAPRVSENLEPFVLLKVTSENQRAMKVCLSERQMWDLFHGLAAGFESAKAAATLLQVDEPDSKKKMAEAAKILLNNGSERISNISLNGYRMCASMMLHALRSRKITEEQFCNVMACDPAEVETMFKEMALVGHCMFNEMVKSTNEF